jgi:uncharacterized membrane protein YeaQ/YmgE (transglycosylase-associated protein family)
MLFIIWIVVGGILGWLASLVMKTDAEQGMILNVVVGIVGAFLGGWLLSPLFGTGTINSDDFSVTSLLVSFLGAVILDRCFRHKIPVDYWRGAGDTLGRSAEPQAVPTDPL